jgi:hypothetical protein
LVITSALAGTATMRVILTAMQYEGVLLSMFDDLPVGNFIRSAYRKRLARCSAAVHWSFSRIAPGRSPLPHHPARLHAIGDACGQDTLPIGPAQRPLLYCAQMRLPLIPLGKPFRTILWVLIIRAV